MGPMVHTRLEHVREKKQECGVSLDCGTELVIEQLGHRSEGSLQ